MSSTQSRVAFDFFFSFFFSSPSFSPRQWGYGGRERIRSQTPPKSRSGRCRTCVTSSYTVSHHHTLCHGIIQCHVIIHSVTSSYTVSRHHTQCHIINPVGTAPVNTLAKHYVRNTLATHSVSHHHTQCHIIIHTRRPRPRCRHHQTRRLFSIFILY